MKTFAISNDNGKWGTLKLAHDVNQKPFDATRKFHPWWETSNLIDLFLDSPYGEITFKGDGRDYIRGAATMLAQIGGAFIRETGKAGFIPAGYSNELHYVLYGDWLDDGTGTVIVVPARFIAPDGRRVRSLYEMIGLKLHIKNRSDRLKARKYMKRLKATHRWAVPGTFSNERTVDVHNETVEVEHKLLPGEKFLVGRHIVGQALDLEFGEIQTTVIHIDLDSQYGEDSEEKAAVDGACYIQVGLLHDLGEQLIKVAENGNERRMAKELIGYQVGDAFKGTYCAGQYFGKGHWHVIDNDSPYGIIVYGPKRQLEFKHVFLGSLGDNHGSSARTSIQDVLSFLHNGTRDLWAGLSREHMMKVHKSVHDEEAMRHLFLTHIAPLANMLDVDEETWSLIEAMKAGVPILRFPGLFRKVVRHLLTVAMQCEKGRIPYGDKAYRADFMIDPNVIDFRTGHEDVRKSKIGEECVCCMDAPAGQWIVIYRSPLANNQEAIVAFNITEDERRKFKRFMGRGRIIFGKSVKQQLKKAGGADLDDAGVVLTDPEWVEAFAQTVPYPKVPLKKGDAAQLASDEGNPFIEGGTWQIGGETYQIAGMQKRLKEPREWSLGDLHKSCADAVQVHLSIGPLDNAIRLDRQLSGDHKAFMLQYLFEKIKEYEAKGDRDMVNLYAECAIWLEHREDDQLREIASNLEDFIDAVRMGRGDMALLGRLEEMANHVTQHSKVYPRCWTWMGRGKGGRIPQFRIDVGDYVIAPSLLDETLDSILQDREWLEQALIEEEWRMVQPLPISLEVAFPRREVISNFAKQLRTLWYEGWQLWFNGMVDRNRLEPVKASQISKAMKVIIEGGVFPLKGGGELVVPGVRKQFLEATALFDQPGMYDEALQAEVAVEVARRTYSQTYDEAQRNAEGNRRTYPDGLLWTNFMGKAFIKGLEMAGLTGVYIPVEFDRYDRALRQGRIQVKIVDGIITRLSDGHHIGMISDQVVPDGDYWMVDGLVYVKEASPELTGIVSGEVGLGTGITNE